MSGCGCDKKCCESDDTTKDTSTDKCDDCTCDESKDQECSECDKDKE